MKFKPLQNFPENQNKPEKPFSKVWIYFIVEIFMQKKNFLLFFIWENIETHVLKKENSNSSQEFLSCVCIIIVTLCITKVGCYCHQNF
jgi:hypothetical protein